MKSSDNISKHLSLDPFSLEESRHTLASRRIKKEFLKTYSSNMPAIEDKNTATSWERQLHESPNTPDPMTIDRIKQTARMITPLRGTAESKAAPISKAALSKTKLLDIGIGNAWVEKKVLSRHPKEFDITGVDITQENLKKIQSEINGEFHVGHILKLPKSVLRQKFHYILLLEVLEHIPFIHTFEVLKNIHNLLEKNGYFIISVPVYENLQEKIAEGRNHSHHVRRYTPEIVKYELELSGFRVEQQKMLYAFSKGYFIKSLIARITGARKPNVIVLKCRKV